jgi:hypothetical protein
MKPEEEIFVSRHDDWDKEPVMARFVPAGQRTIAVHQALGRDLWTVTHVPTGYAFAHFIAQEQAIEFATTFWKSCDKKQRRTLREQTAATIIADADLRELAHRCAKEVRKTK